MSWREQIKTGHAVPTPEQIPFLSSLGDAPAPRIHRNSPRWHQLTTQERVLLAMPENGPEGWATWVTDYAEARGWTWWHDLDARRNAAGFPDYLLIRERVVWVELKSETGTVRPAQRKFAARLVRAGQEYHLWRPRNRAEVLEVLR